MLSQLCAKFYVRAVRGRVSNDGINTDFVKCCTLPTQNKHSLEINKFGIQKFSSFSDNKDIEEDNISPTNRNYYDIDYEFTKANLNPSNYVSILNLNIHSVQKHIEVLRVIINLLTCKLVIALYESKIQ